MGSSLYEQYYALRKKRLSLQREADKLEQAEKDIAYELTKNLSQPKYTGQEGVYTFKAERKMTALATNWEAILGFVKSTGQVDLLQKRLTESAVKARWDDGVVIPGVEPAFKYVVTITKEPT